MPQPPVLPVRTPARPELEVKRVQVIFTYVNDAVREITANLPLDARLAILPAENTAGLGPGMASEQRKEPRIGVFFEGNPDAGGVEVHAEGVVPSFSSGSGGSDSGK